MYIRGTADTAQHQPIEIMDEDEMKKLQVFKDAVIQKAIKYKEKELHTPKQERETMCKQLFRGELAAQFGEDWYMNNAHRIPALINKMREEQRLQPTEIMDEGIPDLYGIFKNSSTVDTEQHQPTEIMDEDETKKLQDFKDAVLQTAIKYKERQLDTPLFHAELRAHSARFGEDWFNDNAHHIPELVYKIHEEQRLHEKKKLQEFKESMSAVIKKAVSEGVTRLNEKLFRDKLSALFGEGWFNDNAHRIPGLLKELHGEHKLHVLHKKKMKHFVVCIQGMTQSALEKKQTMDNSKCRDELVPIFGAEWFTQNSSSIPTIVQNYMVLVNDSGVQRARITPKYDMPLAISSFQGMHPTCSTHAVAFCIAAHLHRLYGQAYAVGRDQILHIMQGMCGCWGTICVGALVARMQATICDNENVWFSNGWSDRRLRFSVSASRINDFESMAKELRMGIVVPTVVNTDITPHAVCAIQMKQRIQSSPLPAALPPVESCFPPLESCLEYHDKAEALNSWGRQHPVVTVTKNDPEGTGEFQFRVAFNLRVRIVAVRSGDNLAIPVPPCKSW